MKNKVTYYSLLPVYCLILLTTLVGTVIGNKVVTVFQETRPVTNRTCFVIDPGHGGPDGGATSCTGVLESNLNLEISLKLNDLMHLLGMNTCMIRKTDCSVYTSGDTIAAKKVSDIKERVRIVNSTPNSILLSIHQNFFPDSQYSGPQVFYGSNSESKAMAEYLQEDLTKVLSSGHKRSIKKAQGIYLMEHITQPGVLIECGFISNPEEEAALRDPAYQQKLCAVIASSVSRLMGRENPSA